MDLNILDQVYRSLPTLTRANSRVDVSPIRNELITIVITQPGYEGTIYVSHDTFGYRCWFAMPTVVIADILAAQYHRQLTRDVHVIFTRISNKCAQYSPAHIGPSGDEQSRAYCPPTA